MNNLILVVGATGGVGKRVVKRLENLGSPCRALVRDREKAREILGDQVSLIEADITIAATLTPEVFAGVGAVICCTGVKVQPVGGDTSDRAKYYQGLKFYMPEVVDSPEIVDYQGIKNLVTAAHNYLPLPGVQTIFDFSAFDFSASSIATIPKNYQEIWGVINDGVMGGLSQSSFTVEEDYALFSGQVSIANSGGFASTRTRNFEPAINLESYQGITLKVWGDGNRYKLFLRTEATWDGVAYAASFDTIQDQWLDINIPFVNFVPVFRAKTLDNVPPINPQKITALQLMLSKFEFDGELNSHFEPGDFAIKVKSIHAYGGRILPQFIMISSAGVTRPGRPGINLAEEPPAVRMNDQLGGILTWKLCGEGAVRSSGVPYTIIRPCALTEKPGGKVLILEQGDNIRGQVTREDIAELCIQTLSQAPATNTTFEVKEGETDAPINVEMFGAIVPD